MIYAFGAFGTNNIGDEAILAGMRSVYNGVKAVYVNKLTDVDSIYMGDFPPLKQPPFPIDCTEIIIGGGGLLYTEQVLQYYVDLLRLAKAYGVPASIQRIGAEGIVDCNIQKLGLVVDMCKLATSISVRSHKSKEILSKYTVKPIKVEPDFAYSLYKENLPQYEYYKEERIPRIGVVLNGMASITPELLKVIRECTIKSPLAYFHFIPHSRPYVSINNNDVIAQEHLWSSIDIYHANREQRIVLHQFSPFPMHAVNLYQAMDGIIGLRYHSFIFSELTQKPLISYASGVKFQSYFLETKRTDATYLDPTNKTLVYQGLMNFITRIALDKSL